MQQFMNLLTDLFNRFQNLTYGYQLAIIGLACLIIYYLYHRYTNKQIELFQDDLVLDTGVDTGHSLGFMVDEPPVPDDIGDISLPPTNGGEGVFDTEVEKFMYRQLMKRIEKLQSINQENAQYYKKLNQEQRSLLLDVIEKRNRELTKLQDMVTKIEERLAPLAQEQNKKLRELMETQQAQSQQPPQPQPPQPQPEPQIAIPIPEVDTSQLDFSQQSGPVFDSEPPIPAQLPEDLVTYPQDVTDEDVLDIVNFPYMEKDAILAQEEEARSRAASKAMQAEQEEYPYEDMMEGEMMDEMMGEEGAPGSGAPGSMGPGGVSGQKGVLPCMETYGYDQYRYFCRENCNKDNDKYAISKTKDAKPPQILNSASELLPAKYSKEVIEPPKPYSNYLYYEQIKN